MQCTHARAAAECHSAISCPLHHITGVGGNPLSSLHTKLQVHWTAIELIEPRKKSWTKNGARIRVGSQISTPSLSVWL